MSDPLARRLATFGPLSQEDRQFLAELTSRQVRLVEEGDDLAREGEAPDHVYIVLEGWAYRYKMLEDGRRQITSLFLPGDVCDLAVFVLRAMDHSIAAMTPLRVAWFDRDVVEVRLPGYPRVQQALWWDSLVSTATQREWTVNLGQRTAYERMGHLFCELYTRLNMIGLTRDTSFDFPMTQAELGEVSGLSTVHVNRTLQALRNDNLITLRGRVLTIQDLPRLKAASLFQDLYLHLDKDGRVVGDRSARDAVA